MKDRFAKLEWERGCEAGALMVVSRTQIACIARYFKNSQGTWTALGRSFTRADLAEKAIERAFVWKGR